MAEWIRVRNWEKWQSYRSDRGQPPWIKVHREVMRNSDWVALSDAQRGQLLAIWLLAADRNGVIPASPALVQKLCYLDDTPDLQLFATHGFLEPDASLTPARRQRDPPEAEAEAEEEALSSESVSVFEEVWKLHGRGAKAKALTEYRRAVPGKVSHDDLVRALKAYRQTFTGDFQGAHLFRWIRDARWEESHGTNGKKPDPKPVTRNPTPWITDAPRAP